MRATLTIHTPESVSEQAFDAPLRLSALLTTLAHPCGGRGTCRACRVQVIGALSARTGAEQALPQGTRLTCQAVALGDCIVWLNQNTQSVQLDGLLPDFALDPWATGEGIAIDIGTTTLALYRYDLQTGRLIAQAGCENPQTAFGADVVTRLMAAENGQGEALGTAVREGILKLVDRTGGMERLTTAVIGGNTAMLHLLCALSPDGLTRSPFVLKEPFGRQFPALFPGISTYIAPCVGPFVGADAVLAALSAGFLESGISMKPRLLLDIGTNGEMVLSYRGRLTACATAAGPALEGAGISCGMMAKPGAIRRVTLSGGHLAWETVDGLPAIGLCGSGLIDLIACLLDMGVIDETGYMASPFTLPDTEVTLTPHDVRAVQLAKAAIHAGVLTLLAEAGLDTLELDCILLAGAFGAALSPESAQRVGLIPAACSVVPLGNAAGMGASMVLLSRRCKEAAERYARRIEIIPLATSPVFQEAYMEQMLFPEEGTP